LLIGSQYWGSSLITWTGNSILLLWLMCCMHPQNKVTISNCKKSTISNKVERCTECTTGYIPGPLGNKCEKKTGLTKNGRHLLVRVCNLDASWLLLAGERSRKRTATC